MDRDGLILLPILVLYIAMATGRVEAASAPAFPGAEGFGSRTPGGRGGRVIEVTNLNDSGPGSFRAAVEAEGPRIVVFRVGGTIELESGIRIENPYITIAGQTAPGGGIALKNGPSTGTPLSILTHDVIVRYLRVRPGAGGEPDGVRFSTGAADAIVDHCSVSWAVDENVSSWRNPHDLTVQWCIVAEGLRNSTHHKGAHSMGFLFGSEGCRNLSIHHNLLAHNNARNPRIKTSGVVDFVNNVVYNYGGSVGVFTDDYALVTVNYVGNYVKRGPDSSTSAYEVDLVPVGGFGFSIYVEGNIGPHRAAGTEPEFAVVHPEDRGYITGVRHSAPTVTTTSPLAAYEQVLRDAGATLPMRDAVDERIVSDVRNGTGRIIDDPSEVGGWPVLAPGTPPRDSDHDGMPDEWENLHGFGPDDPSDGPEDADGDGYTNVEEFLNGTDPRVAEYSLIIDRVGQGDVTVDPPGGTYNDGEVLTLTAVAAPGWRFDGWSGDLVGSENPIAFTIDYHSEIKANFIEISSHASSETNAVPRFYRLYQNSPNPFNSMTRISYSLPRACSVRLTVFDVAGRTVATLVDGYRDAGTYTHIWEAVDSDGHQLPSGIYLCKIRAGAYRGTIKIVLLR